MINALMSGIYLVTECIFIYLFNYFSCVDSKLSLEGLVEKK